VHAVPLGPQLPLSQTPCTQAAVPQQSPSFSQLMPAARHVQVPSAAQVIAPQQSASAPHGCSPMAQHFLLPSTRAQFSDPQQSNGLEQSACEGPHTGAA
jgi:hypothetical protein